jgi:hypothetical protein
MVIDTTGFRTDAAPKAPPIERRVRPDRWFSAIGAMSILMAVYLVVAWVASGEFKRTPTGRDPVSAATKAWAWGWQVASIVLFLACVAYVVRRSRREGRLTFDALILIAWTIVIWLDPATTNFFRTQMLYNSYLVNFGSWAPQMPGWLSPNAHLFPEPLIAWGGLYGVTSLGATVIGCNAMRLGKRRWPELGKVGTVLCGLAAIAITDLLLEIFFIRTGLYAYGGAIRSLSLWGGHRYQFPLYESLIFGATWTASAALRYFRDDRGLSIVERGIVETTPPARLKTARRVLAVTGFVTVIYVVYSLVFSLTALWGDPFPTGYPSYMINGMCGAPTPYQCVS